LGRAWRNAGWPYFDGKFASFQAIYHYGTSSRELVQQFPEMCLPEKIAARIKSAETMEIAWVRLDAWFKDKGAFIKDLMQDIQIVSAIKDGDDECLRDYYMMLQLHIEEARIADLLGMLLIPANAEVMGEANTTAEIARVRLDAWFKDEGAFIKDLMQDIQIMSAIKDGDDERLRDYYVMLQSHIQEARNADLLGMLLIPANAEVMKEANTTAEIPRAGIPGSWPPQRVGAGTRRRCTSHL
jgi:hypothetical protein